MRRSARGLYEKISTFLGETSRLLRPTLTERSGEKRGNVANRLRRKVSADDEHERIDDLREHRWVVVARAKSEEDLASEICRTQRFSLSVRIAKRKTLTHLRQPPRVEVAMLAPLDKLPQPGEMRPLNRRLHHTPESKVEHEEPKRQRVRDDRLGRLLEVVSDERHDRIVRLGSHDPCLGLEQQCKNLVPLHPLRILGVPPALAHELDEQLDRHRKLLARPRQLDESKRDGDSSDLPDGDVEALRNCDTGVSIEVPETVRLDERLLDLWDRRVDDDLSSRRRSEREGLLSVRGEPGSGETARGAGDEGIEGGEGEVDAMFGDDGGAFVANGVDERGVGVQFGGGGGVACEGVEADVEEGRGLVRLELAELILEVGGVPRSECRADVYHLLRNVAVDKPGRSQVPLHLAPPLPESASRDPILGRSKPALDFPVFRRCDGVGGSGDFDELAIHVERNGRVERVLGPLVDDGEVVEPT